jgi:3-hydroxyisobutyrate dehydrogenase-like beta-hydroxyacid dehydrogenase
MKVGWIGLGTMGGPMAGHVLARGGELVVWNRTPSRAAAIAAQGARVATSPAALAAQVDVLMLCVTGSEDVQGLAAEISPALSPHAIVVDHTTIDPTVSREIAVGFGDRWIDAPVTGGSMGAVNGNLTALCGGSESTLAVVRSVLEAYCRRIEYVGPSGHGQLMKAVNQVAVAGSLMGLCESMALAERAGLDLVQVRELLASGAAGSWSFENYGPKLLSRDWTPGFSVSNQLKDLRYCLKMADQFDARLPMTAATADVLEEMVEDGRGSDATVAVFEHLAEESR